MTLLKTFSGRRASQNEFELGALVDLLRASDVRSYLEIGSRDGDTFVAVMESLPPGSTGVAVDWPGAVWGKSTTRAQLEKAVTHLQTRGYRASLLFGDSQNPGTRRIVIGRGPYDAVLIDADHRYEGVRKDWELYGPLGRIVAFHDIVGTGESEQVYGYPVEVPRLWAEIKSSGVETAEFVAPESRMGIGVVLR